MLHASVSGLSGIWIMVPEWFTWIQSKFTSALDWSIFTIGAVPITPLFLLKACIFLLFLALLSGISQKILIKKILRRTRIDPGQQYAISRFASYLVFLFGLLIGLQTTGLNLSSLVVVGGALGIGVGLGLQNAVSNFVAGLILLLEHPIKLGDRIEVGDTYGDVIQIGARSTWVRTNDNVVIILPNSEFINKPVTNWTANDRQVRISLDVGVAYSTNPELVREILTDVAKLHEDVLSDPPPEVLFVEFGDSSLNFLLRVWTITQVQYPVRLKSSLNFDIFKAFAKNGIEVPFPQRDIHIRSVEGEIPLRLNREAQ
ncbi:MAG TPA: mechanosensitive ion channel domain-containing protein [Terracidiphilus sp.]|nr:mechanosensitive ion channel domain-containing protein [Terracidiphilus sp.]